ncbi:hypothetical protein NC652_035318 [Populus alba x Populus x berolinensis]|nr:hypothetical protein NC652_035318 [Populus alba x Populus x berolinensis]
MISIIRTGCNVNCLSSLQYDEISNDPPPTCCCYQILLHFRFTYIPSHILLLTSQVENQTKQNEVFKKTADSGLYL